MKRNTETMQFAVEASNGVVTRIGNGVIMQPRAGYKGKTDNIKWLEDKFKTDSKGKTL